MLSRSRRIASALMLTILSAAAFPTHAQHGTAQYQVLPPEYGPYSAHVLAGGADVVKALPESDPLLRATTPWTLSAWVDTTASAGRTVLVGGVGDPFGVESRYLALVDGHAGMWAGKDNQLTATTSIGAGAWHLLAATFDGTLVRLYCDGAEVAKGTLLYGRFAPEMVLAPNGADLPGGGMYGGRIALLTLARGARSADEMRAMAQHAPDASLIGFEEASKPWPLQTRGQAGYSAPQDAATLPRSAAPYSEPHVAPEPPAHTTLRKDGDGGWTFEGGWRLTPAPKVSAAAEQIAQPGFHAGEWWAATVPGTVLTTMVDRGVYPDPDYGLNNLAIPESLNKQDYWYRSEFTAPKQVKGERRTLVLEGINYHAEVWLNGKRVGQVTGAFERGIFDVTDVLHDGGANALAIRISPPPHPGIPQEQSILGGPGENGGAMCLDGPTFVATEGWDWIPAERDRDTGLWQDVRLLPSGAVEVRDPQVITRLPRLATGALDTTQADLAITVPLHNAGHDTIKGRLIVSFEGAEISREVSVGPGEQTVRFAAKDTPQLHLQHPRLWWPNGYGKPELYHLRVTFTDEAGASSATVSQFGVREVSYELSLFDEHGAIRRVDYTPADDADRAGPAVDVSHEGMRVISHQHGTAQGIASIVAGQEDASSLHEMSDRAAAPYLVLRVNGVRIAARGGNWGMDDARKRVSRERLEPYFRLHRDAGLNIIRNWVGQSTEETFYQLADEYGLMVWNDFWDSTQNYNIEAQDPELFLDNARDTILRYRNHPSIVLWCGRNEGVPQPVINEGLIHLIHTLDGTRYYSPSSNEVNLQQSGPYSYQDPADYYTKLNAGFSVETGTPSLPTRQWFDRWLPQADRWPVSDDWAYHDWHQAGNGDVSTFNEHMEAQFGAATSLDDYVRKAQMMNYVDHRAIFEGMSAHLWTPNSGRLLWMTHPAWPSTMWEIYTSDYDTQASYYGTKKACEALHVQLNPANATVSVANLTTEARPGLKLSARVYSLDGKALLTRDAEIDAAADVATQGFALELTPLMGDAAVLIRLELRGSDGSLLSENTYWLAAKESGYRAMTRMSAAPVSIAAARGDRAGTLRVTLHNSGTAPALAAKVTLLSAADSPVLPAYYSDNYISLLPGESREITIDALESAHGKQLQIELTGWNVQPVSASVAQ